MLSIAFGQSKYYVDNLSENVKRGLRQKLRNGIWPSRAPSAIKRQGPIPPHKDRASSCENLWYTPRAITQRVRDMKQRA
jgi:hypothetical protein